MPNWCYNVVRFQGDAHLISETERFFKAMAAREKQQLCGQLPDFATVRDDHFFCIQWKDNALHYETRWCPNTYQLVTIADHLHVNFKHNYEETEMLIYGQATYSNGKLSTVDLDPADFELYQYDGQQDDFLFEGKHYPDYATILEILLERKMQYLP
ncbi:MAG: hypothetical protein H3C48_19015, partial [Chitinophagaceae bacterium]|nr:hypothetical protein [Chitinophagaceae bacterium]